VIFLLQENNIITVQDEITKDCLGQEKRCTNHIVSFALILVQLLVIAAKDSMSTSCISCIDKPEKLQIQKKV